MSDIDEVLAWITKIDQRFDSGDLDDDGLKHWLAQHIVARDAVICAEAKRAERGRCVMIVRERADALGQDADEEDDDHCAAHLLGRAGALSDVAKELEMTDEDRYEQLSRELGLKLAKEALRALGDSSEKIVLYEGGEHPPPWNPPLPDGARYMHQSEVTQEVATWASMILRAPNTYPLHCMVRLDKLAAFVQWHTYQGATGKHGLFRGVSLIVFEDEEERQ